MKSPRESRARSVVECVSLSLFLCVISCSSPEHAPAIPVGGGDGGGDVTPVVDAASETTDANDANDAPETSAPITLHAAATHGSFTAADIGVTIHGNGAASVGAITIDSGRGTLQLDVGHESRPPTSAFVMAHQPFHSLVGDFDLYQTIVVASDRVSIVWLYCTGGALASTYVEDSRGVTTGNENATGTCDTPTGSATVAVDLPAFSFTAPALSAHVTAHGTGKPAIEFTGTSPGTIDGGGRSLLLYPFNVVDCTVDCSKTGWRELHALVWDPAKTELTLGIVYLFPPAAGRDMQLSYAITLPTLATPLDETFPGTWTFSP